MDFVPATITVRVEATLNSVTDIARGLKIEHHFAFIQIHSIHIILKEKKKKKQVIQLLQWMYCLMLPKEKHNMSTHRKIHRCQFSQFPRLASSHLLWEGERAWDYRPVTKRDLILTGHCRKTLPNTDWYARDWNHAAFKSLRFQGLVRERKAPSIVCKA